MTVCQRVRDTGSVIPQCRNRGNQRPADIIQKEEQMLNLVDENPGASSREIGRQVGVSHWTVLRTFREQLLYPYHVQRVQCLLPNDYPPRVIFCEWLQQQCAQNQHFLSNILVTDEACFTRNGIMNFHNTHTWAVENPKTIQQRAFQHRFSINVWAGIIGDHLVGPFVLPDRLTGRTYERFLQDDLPTLLDEVPLQTRRTMWFLHDGAPPHISREVRRHLHRTYPDRLIGRFGHIHWPARSPDLNPLDFYFWGDMKGRVYKSEIGTVDELRDRIFRAADQIRNNRDILRKVWENWLRRTAACIEANGSHFEHHL